MLKIRMNVLDNLIHDKLCLNAPRKGLREKFLEESKGKEGEKNDGRI